MKKLLFLFLSLFLLPPLLNAQTITYSGTNVGIGSASPGQTLDIQGTMRATGLMAPLQLVELSNTQTSGTSGGAATSGGWAIIPLNTTDLDTSGNLVSNSSSAGFVLNAGTYDIIAREPFWEVGAAQTRLQDTTDSTTLLPGSSVEAGIGTGSTTTEPESWIIGRFTIGASKTLQFQYIVGNTKSSDGLGTDTALGTETYAKVSLRRVQ